MKKLLVGLLVLGMVLMAGPALAGWGVYVGGGATADGNTVPYSTIVTGGASNYGWLQYSGAVNNNGTSTYRNGFVAGGTGGNVTKTYNKTYTTDTGSIVKQSGGFSVQSTSGYNGTVVRAWSSSSVSSGQ